MLVLLSQYHGYKLRSGVLTFVVAGSLQVYRRFTPASKVLSGTSKGYSSWRGSTEKCCEKCNMYDYV